MISARRSSAGSSVSGSTRLFSWLMRPASRAASVAQTFGMAIQPGRAPRTLAFLALHPLPRAMRR